MSAYIRDKLPLAVELLLKRVDLTQQMFLDLGGGWRLAAVIHYLKWKRGWPIISTLDMRGCAHYRLLEGWTPENLKK